MTAAPSSNHTGNTNNTTKSRFPIPVSIHDLEREPYNLLPYPNDFDDDNNNNNNNDETRIHSFQKLVYCIEQGNRCLNGTTGNNSNDGSMMNLFMPTPNDDDGDTNADMEGEDEPWMDETRIQALYTLVRYVL